jgi:dipeptidyl aminopeptidase/acylaminoacyl peptidase
MKTTRIGLLLVALLSGLPAAEPPAPPTPEQIFGLPQVSQARLSPDGTKIAFLFPHEKKMALGLFDRATKESRIILRGKDESIRRFFWKGNDRLVFQADVAGNESFFIGSTDLTGTRVLRIAESQRIENNLTGDFAGIIDELRFDPQRIGVYGYFAGNIDNSTFIGGAPIVGRLNVRNRGLSPIFEIKEDDRFHGIFFDHRGVLRMRGRILGNRFAWEYRDHDNQPFKVVAEHPYHGYEETWDPDSFAFAADNHTLWMISREEHDRGALYTVNTRTFERGPALFVPPEGEITSIILSYDRSKLLGVRYELEREHYHWFDEKRAALQAKLAATFVGCDIRIASTSEDERVALIWVGHDREPGVYYVLDQNAGSLTQFKRMRDLDPAKLSPRKPIKYTARDGLTIHGYLTLPPGSNGKNLPMVVHPHGGPFGVRDYWGYDADAQFLATRGYAVLQPNFRGSGGYGREFVNKGKRQWGRAMQDDLTDGVKWAIEQGIADPARVAIYGASYGGYAALIGAMLTPDLYACAVNYVGASDLEITYHQRGEDAWRGRDEFSYRNEWVGPTRAYRDETSPLNLVDRIKIPTLHVYGAEDPRVKINHWTRLEPLLKKYGKDYQAIVEGQQGHGFHDEKETLSFYAALEKFLANNLRDRKPEVNVGNPRVIEMPAKR